MTTDQEARRRAAERSRTRADDRYVFHSWSAQGAIDPLPVAGGEGAWFWDEDGNRYLDFASQLVNLNLGHQHPRLVAALQAQAGRLATVGPTFASDVRGELARLIAERAPGSRGAAGTDGAAGAAAGDDRRWRVFFTNGGADAVENAVRLARLHTGRAKVLSAYRSYHGNTTTAISLTGDPRRWPNEVSPDPHVRHFLGPYAYRSAFGARDDAEEGERALAHLREVVQLEGPGTVAAILLETIVGTNGVLIPPDGYLEGVRELCDEHGILLVTDEVMVGFGRVGEWFAVDRWGVVPDLVTFAKGVNSGYVPLGGVIIGEHVARTFDDRVFPGGLTYSGHPLACAVGVESVRTFEDERILDRVRTLGADVVGPRLREIADRHPSVGEVRGLGFFWAVELVRDRATREPLVPFNASGAAAAPMGAVVAAVKERGVWPFVHFNRLHVAPPLVTSAEDLEHGLAAIDEALDVADGYAGVAT
ncbi:aspartate aminotransferase family protein [Cellulosimicrobium composti]|uniref:Aspartate aminotransferase family protein n=1 Tax=Cellulosimicrobium composti TaxID=2672572 RepID=A0ABX0BB77_9MICO|nr:aspartate aminotransferase family protein [Cellulosimicrobium composti]NDO89416.1 aspartate aminotransferase family protein [Cellulosimicrobium composti]